MAAKDLAVVRGSPSGTIARRPVHQSIRKDRYIGAEHSTHWLFQLEWGHESLLVAFGFSTPQVPADGYLPGVGAVVTQRFLP